MKIDENYERANENKQAIELLPEIVTFLASIARADNNALEPHQSVAALTELADQAENLKFKMGYGY
jgi:hypothetical protein